MFPANTYTQRRKDLAKSVKKGKILLLGNNEAGMNYKSNTYHFRQDSNFLYFVGIDRAGIAAVIDCPSGQTTLIGDEATMDDIVWTGPLPTLKEQAALSGIKKQSDWKDIDKVLKTKEQVHFLPPYRGDQTIQLGSLLGMNVNEVVASPSMALIQGIVALRSYKSEEELVELDKAVFLTNEVHKAAMRVAAPGLTEADVHAAMQKVIHAHETHLSFPAIVTVNGQVLHNHDHGNTLKKGQLLLVDAGAESLMRYAGDMTRTFPVDPMFTERQAAVYNTCLNSQFAAIEALKPGVSNRDVHLLSAQIIAQGLKEIGLMKGDTDEAVAAGAHALFFPHGLGHMMGLDVHDMEGLGEDNVGYDDEFKRSDQFGLAFLRLGRRLEAGFVLTIEPGIYFIPELIDMWKAEGKHKEFLNYDKIEGYKDFGGIRIEDDYVITDDGARRLGGEVPKTIADVEAFREEA